MSTAKLIAVLAVLAGLLAGCQAQGAGDPRIAEIEQSQASMESRLEDLEAKLAETEGRNQAFQVVIANNALESAGLHEIDESINEQGEIQPEFLGNVNRLRILVSGANWPEALEEDLAALLATLADLSDAISADDAAAAGPLAAQAHEQQHEFSHEVGEWLAENVPGIEIEEESE